ncbi:hypothetical protein AB5J62_07215 [Amycolatopsis sp. cg5]|uniref:terpene synthase family protein n=1 Tax=Amycolatopsis sp. cg5 TaxID=3238802 RepID=UPI0035248B12
MNEVTGRFRVVWPPAVLARRKRMGSVAEMPPPPLTSFDIPFTIKQNPHLDRARAHTLNWLRGKGIVRDEDDAARYVHSRVADAVAHFYPEAGPEDLELASDLVALFFFCDDQFDGLLGQDPGAVAQVCRRLFTVIRRRPHAPPIPDPTPMESALSELWENCCLGMSETWRIRAVHNWADYLFANVTEAQNRVSGTLPALHGLLELRRVAVIVYVLLDLAERVNHTEIPAFLAECQQLREMRDITAETVCLLDDVRAVERGEAGSDIHNVVLALESEYTQSRGEVIVTVREMIEHRIRRFERLPKGVPALCESMGASAAAYVAVDLSVETMCWLMRGTYEWGTGDELTFDGQVAAW